MFLLFTALDLLAINEILSQRSEEMVQFATMWLLFYSSVVAWVVGSRAWKQCRDDCPAAQTLLRLLTCSSLVYAGCAAAFRYGGSPESWAGIWLFLVVYLIRLTPPAAATILVTPFLWISQPQSKTLVLVVICQISCWFGGYVLTGGQQGWQPGFLYVGLWAPSWSYALMVGGLLLKPLLGGDSQSADRRPN